MGYLPRLPAVESLEIIVEGEWEEYYKVEQKEKDEKGERER